MDYFTHQQIAVFIYSTIVFLFSAAVHEYCHALAATLYGDDLPTLDGRLTLNPLAHFDILGFFALFVFGIGWAKPVRYNPFNLRNPRFNSVVIALVGPFSNLVLAILSLFILKYLPILGISNEALVMTLTDLLQYAFSINVMLFVLNMLPIPALDGSNIITSYFPEPIAQFYWFLQPYGYLILMILLTIPYSLGIYLYLMNFISSFLFHLVF
ncbi:TPA: site-2 protease family protein [Candidatus Dependentiae bacterium]|nr:MAG: Peptidase M50 [candidate division TM6 bacterium GW2011_GWE2_31_21]KKP54117.1 MAG: Peptidase M50 [candidate division TM6 bacterium GW2011_GWF2_33_332]HBS48301.1 site-2 protease family protein [Candidatus Dependentiae bacterium]HBZ73025.1 site-2 protease family protein [Candidatus Dependentiae bacterium]